MSTDPSQWQTDHTDEDSVVYLKALEKIVSRP